MHGAKWYFGLNSEMISQVMSEVHYKASVPLGLKKIFVSQVTRPTHDKKNPTPKSFSDFLGQNWFSVIFSVKETYKPCRCTFLLQLFFNSRLFPFENKYVWLSRLTAIIPYRKKMPCWWHLPHKLFSRINFFPIDRPKKNWKSLSHLPLVSLRSKGYSIWKVRGEDVRVP